jgi:hypothetical protein
MLMAVSAALLVLAIPITGQRVTDPGAELAEIQQRLAKAWVSGDYPIHRCLHSPRKSVASGGVACQPPQITRSMIAIFLPRRRGDAGTRRSFRAGAAEATARRGAAEPRGPARKTANERPINNGAESHVVRSPYPTPPRGKGDCPCTAPGEWSVTADVD